MGIMEELVAALNANTAALLAGGGSTGKAGTVGKAKAKVTADDLTKVVQPLVDIPAKKAKVRAVLDKFSIPKLGDAKEEQYAALLAEFEAIRDEPDAGGDII